MNKFKLLDLFICALCMSCATQGGGTATGVGNPEVEIPSTDRLEAQATGRLALMIDQKFDECLPTSLETVLSILFSETSITTWSEPLGQSSSKRYDELFYEEENGDIQSAPSSFNCVKNVQLLTCNSPEVQAAEAAATADDRFAGAHFLLTPDCLSFFQ